MATFGRILQLLGMTNLLVGLYIGMTEEGGMGPELNLLMVGVVIFLVGRFLVKRGAR
ncbi:MAG: hypothetical protein ACE5HK_01580 [Candidatus Methylomirabilales bacterium]